MDISNVVSVNISRSTLSVAQAAFNVALILGENLMSSARVNYFNQTDLPTLATKLIGGTAAPEYIAAAAYFAQTPCPSRVAIGVMKATKVATITFASDTNSADMTSGSVSATINGRTVTANYDAASEGSSAVLKTLTDLCTAINSAFGLGANGSGATVSEVGIMFIVTVVPNTGLLDVALDFSAAVFDGNSVTAISWAAMGIDVPSAALNACQLENSGWYGLIWAGSSSYPNQAKIDCAVWCEFAPAKKFAVSTMDPNAANVALAEDTGSIAQSDSSNDGMSLAMYLHNHGFNNTICIFSVDNSNFPEAALLGAILWRTPGSYTAMFKQLAGVAPDTLTGTQQVNLHGTGDAPKSGKNCNTYENTAGIPMVSFGQVVSGEYIDVMIFVDWLTATIGTSVFSALANANGKIPFDETGLIAVENAIRAPLGQGITNGGISPTAFDTTTNAQIGGYYIVMPDFASISTTDKANRTLNNVQFVAFLAGAIHYVAVQGNLAY